MYSSMSIRKRLDRLEQSTSSYAWALYRVSARNIKKIVDRWGMEGLALECGQRCTGQFREEVTNVLRLIEEDTPKQAAADDELLREYYEARGWDLYAGYEQCTRRLVECGLLASIEDEW